MLYFITHLYLHVHYHTTSTLYMSLPLANWSTQIMWPGSESAYTALPWPSLSYHILYYVYATAAPHTIASEVLAPQPYTGLRNGYAFAYWETPREAKCLQRKENKYRDTFQSLMTKLRINWHTTPKKLIYSRIPSVVDTIRNQHFVPNGKVSLSQRLPVYFQ